MRAHQINLSPWLSLRSLALLVLVIILGSSCERTEVREVKATVISMAPLVKSKGEQLPVSLYPIFYPAGDCESIYYRVQPTFIRLDLKEAKFEPKLNLSTFSGNKNNPNFVRRLLQKEVLPKIRVGTPFAKPYPEEFDKAAALQYEIDAAGGDYYYLFYANDGRRKATFGEFPVYTDGDSLQAKIGAYYCEKGDASQYLVIVLNPPNEDSSEEGKPDFVENTPSDVDNQSDIKTIIRKILQELSDTNQSTTKRQSKLASYLDHFAAGTDVKVYGPNETLAKIMPIKDYLEAITYYKTIDYLELKEIIVEDDKAWEVRLVEHYQ